MRIENRIDQRFIIIFVGAGVGLILSKGLALIPGFGTDDYSAVHEDRNLNQLLWQGRFTHALIQAILSILGVSPTSIAWPVIILFFFFAALAISAGLIYLSGQRGGNFGLACIAALIGAHPYLTEYFTFRESLITQGFSFAFISLIIVSCLNFDANTEGSKPRYSPLWLSFPMIMLAGVQQTAFIILGFFVLAKLLTDILSAHDGFGVKGVLKKNSPILIAFLFASIVYFIIVLLIRKLGVTPSDERASLIPLSDFLLRFYQISALSVKILFLHEPVLSGPLKIYLLIVLSLFFAVVGIRRPKVAGAILLFSILMYIGSILLVSLSAVWWPVPRAIYGVGFCFGITLALLSPWLPRAGSNTLSIAVLVGAIGLSFQSSSILFDQIRLNRWDMWVAGEIARDLARRGVDGNQRVVLVGAGWTHPLGLNTIQGDLNVSSLAVPWAARHLMMEATARRWNVESINQFDECRGVAGWPANESIKEVAGSIYVCMNQ